MSLVLNGSGTITGATTLASTVTSPTLTTPIITSTLGVGGATPSASGAGITFPATQSASTDANTLDDYEEGTFTPTLTNVTVGNGVLAARYTKVGNVVYVSLTLVYGSTSSFSGIVTGISGLPFASASGNVYYVGAVTFLKQGSGWHTGSCSLNPSTTTTNYVSVSGGVSVMGSSTPFVWAANDYMTFTLTYIAS